MNMSVCSDHSFLNFEINGFSEGNGPGLWRFNNALLYGKKFVEQASVEKEKAKHKKDTSRAA